MTPLQPLLTTGEVAEALSVGPDTVRRWAKDGKLPVVELPSGQRRFRRSDVERILGIEPEPVREAGHAYPVLLHLCLALAVVTLLAAALPGQALAVVAGAALAGLGAGVLWLTVQVCSVVRALDDHP